MADKLAFTLVSPERELFSGPVDQVIVPGEDGDFGVLVDHAPFMSTMRPGAITVLDGGEKRRIFVRGGFADVTPDGLTVLAEEAIPLADVDRPAIEQALTDAREDVGDASDDATRADAEARIARAEAILAALDDTAYA